MKRIAFLTLLAFSATHVALAAPNDAMKEARQNAVNAKKAARSNQQARRIAQPQVQRSIPNPAAQSLRSRNINPQINTSPRITSNVEGDIARRNNRNQIALQKSLNQGQWQGNNDNNRSGKWRNNNDNQSGKWGDNNNDGKWKHRGHKWHRRHSHWNRHHRNRSWWTSNFTRFALFGGGYYYWNSGYWYPAYGYDPYFNSYTYDAPIYAYQDQDPGRVIANVQVELQRRGYDPGGIDGTYGPMTRNALIRYQSDQGLPATGEIDEETLDSLGLR